MSAAFEHVLKRDDVAVDVVVWMVERMPYARLCCEVDDPFERMPLEQFRGGLAVGKVSLLELEARVFAKSFEAGLFQADVVVGVDVVDAEYAVAVSEESFREVEADEAGGARHQDRCRTVS